jgi:MOSC domain-containing protein YiiM
MEKRIAESLLQAGKLEVSAQPHTGCAKFRDRFGADALELVNSPEGRRLHLRGINAKVVRGGAIRARDAVRKLAAEEGAEP